MSSSLKFFKKVFQVSSYVLVVLFLISCGENEASSNITHLNADNKLSKSSDDSVNLSFALEQAIYDQINQYRLQNGLPILQLNLSVSDIARSHSLAIANGNSGFSHDGYEQRTQLISTVVKWEAIGENLAFNNFENPAETAISGWIQSPLHLDNILGEFTLTGVGIAKSGYGDYIITQIFVRN